MLVPYYKGVSGSLKRACSKHGVYVQFKGGITIKNLLVASKEKYPIFKKHESYTDINVTGWSVMKNILVNHQEHVERGSKNIKRPLPQYLTIITSLVTTPVQIISAQWGERTRTSLQTSKKIPI